MSFETCSIRKNRNWNRNLFRHYPKQNVCFGCFASIPKQRVLMFRLNRNKQKTNRNSLIGSIFCNFLQKIYGFFGFFRFFLGFFVFFLGFFGFFSRFFRFVSKQFVSVFRLFRFYTETENFDVSIEPKQTEDQPKQFNYLLSSLYANRAGREWRVLQSFEIVNCILYCRYMYIDL